MPLDDANTLWTLDTDAIAPDVAAELLRQAEVRQAAVFQAALGMDQRAAVLAAGFVAFAGAAVAGGLALADHPAVRAAALAGALVVAVAAGLCAWACRPQPFRFPGVEPLDWGADPAYLREPLHVLQIARAAELQDHLATNERRQKRNGKALSWGLLLAAFAPVAAALTFLAAAS